MNVSLASSILLGDLQLLSRVDLVRVLQDVPVRLEDPLPGVRVPIDALGNLREVVTRLDLVGLVDLRSGCCGRSAALHVREIGHVVVLLLLGHGNSFHSYSSSRRSRLKPPFLPVTPAATARRGGWPPCDPRSTAAPAAGPARGLAPGGRQRGCAAHGRRGPAAPWHALGTWRGRSARPLAPARSGSGRRRRCG